MDDTKAKDKKSKNKDHKVHTKHLLALEESQLKMLESMNNELSKLTSMKHNLYRGMVRGLGTAIGATFVAAIVFWILAQLIGTFDQLPVIGDLIEGFKELERVNESLNQ